MDRNLDVDCFSNGDSIREVSSPNDWRQAALDNEPAWCYYENNAEYGKKYGKLYNWYALKDPRGITPMGWRLPSYSDWIELADYCGGLEGMGSGKKLKSKRDWNGRNGSNDFDFNALPAGERVEFGKFTNIEEKVFGGVQLSIMILKHSHMV